jgi:hypothetical protein
MHLLVALQQKAATRNKSKRRAPPSQALPSVTAPAPSTTVLSSVQGSLGDSNSSSSSLQEQEASTAADGRIVKNEAKEDESKEDVKPIIHFPPPAETGTGFVFVNIKKESDQPLFDKLNSMSEKEMAAMHGIYHLYSTFYKGIASDHDDMLLMLMRNIATVATGEHRTLARSLFTQASLKWIDTRVQAEADRTHVSWPKTAPHESTSTLYHIMNT